jgi:hypothetical protein
MKTALSIIRDFWPFIQQRDLLPDVNGGVVRLQFYRYDLSDFTSPSRFWSFSHGYCHGQNYPSNMCPGGYALENSDSYTRLSSDVDQAGRSLFPGILMLVISSMLVDYFNDCARTYSLGIAAQIKYMGAPLLVFAGIWYDIYVIILWLPSEKYEIISWKKKSLKTSKISLFSY